MKKYPYVFFDDRKVRAVCDEQNAKWWFSVLAIAALLTNQDDLNKTRNYWKYLKAKLRKEKNEMVSATYQLKFLAPDGKKNLKKCTDWSKIGKQNYMNAMNLGPTKISVLKHFWKKRSQPK